MIGKFTGRSPVGIERNQPEGFRTESEAQAFGREWCGDELDLCFRTEWNPAETRCFVEFFLPSPHMTIGWA